MRYRRMGYGAVAASNAQKRTELAETTGVALATLEALVRLADLMRVQ